MLERGTALREAGRLSEAIRLLDEAARLNPGDPEIWLERGIVFDLGGSLDNAGRSYAESARLGGGALALAGCASVATRKSDYATARTAAEGALRLQPGEPIASIALARCELEAGDLSGAEARLRALLAGELSVDDRLIADGLLGDVLDKANRPAEAFAQWARSKALFRERHAPRYAAHPSQAEMVDAIRIAAEAVPPRQWTAQPHTPTAPNHIFLLGYPRSGTTLVENILATVPGVEAAEERPTLQDAERAFLDAPDKLADFAALDAAGLVPYRQAYWQRVRASGIGASPTTLVDMDPFKGSRLPLIARLFPAARIVVMRRDPRDVVLSCFRTSFTPSAIAYQFAALEGVARHYDSLMRLQHYCLATMPLAVHELRYEALIADFDATTRDLCAFTGVPWSEDLRRFDRTAARRGVSTASQTQVRRGLYDGREQWRRYAAELAPIMPLLAPWIEAFGYAGTP